MKANYESTEISRAVIEVISRSYPDAIESKSLVRDIRAAIHNAMTVSKAEIVTPPALAKTWGISADKVLNWIRSGELEAVNVASDPSTRPKYKITPQAIQKFCDRRTSKPKPKQTKRRRIPNDVVEFF